MGDHPNAVAQIRADLGALERRRRLSVAAYVAFFLVLVVAFLLAPKKPTALPRDPAWVVALGVLFATSAIATAAAIGLPLWRRTGLRILTMAAGAGLVGALLLISDGTTTAALSMGAPCFLYGTVVSGGAMIGLGFLSGTLWRRFPDPGLILAIGVTGVGVTALHFSCGGSDPGHLLFHVAPLIVIYAIARGVVRMKEKLLRDDSISAPSR